MKTLFKQSSLLILTQFLLLSIGCSEEQRGGPREETSPITGIIHVDGKPVGDLQIKAIPETPEGVNETFTIAGFTDPEGKFSLSTYEAGDGAPEGDYKLIFMWGATISHEWWIRRPRQIKEEISRPKNV